MKEDNNDGFINNEKIINQLADKVLEVILQRYADISPLTLLANEEELLISELARLNTILAMLEQKEQYRKAAIILRKIKRIQKKLNNL